MAKVQSSLVAYAQDGRAVSFTHAVDYNDALSRGYSANPPGVKMAKKKIEPEGESVSGISTLAEESIVEDEKLVPLAKAAAEDATSKIRRK